jgi:serine/threonine-protein kinase RsbW
MAESLRLKITSDPANLAAVRQAVEALCQRHGFDEEAYGDVGLCVNEAMANVIRHAYGGAKDRPIEINADCDKQQVRVTIRDWGNGVDPSQLPQNQKPRDPLKPGGLGLVCMREMLDRFEFHAQPDGMLLEMVKHAGTENQLRTDADRQG